MAKERRTAGMLAEFETPEAILDAARAAYGAGYRQLDAFTPYPVRHLSEAIGFTHDRVAAFVLAGGLLGGVGGYLLQCWAAIWSYPINVGGRPFHSWPSFIPVTFELTVLCASLFAVLSFLFLNGLPQPYHPVFNEPRFLLASRDRFFLYLEAGDPLFDAATARGFLKDLGAHGVYEIAA